MGFLHPRYRAWRVTLLILLAITLVAGVIGRAVVVSLENDEQVTQVERLYRCDSLGIAGPMSWENMTIEEFQVMVQEMADIGAAWIRIGVIWRDVEPSRGNFEWDGLDQRLQLAVDAGLRPLLLIHTTPSWIDDVGEVGNGTAQEFARFSGEVAERYHEQADGYEIWNEPNLDRFWAEPSPESYAELLTATAPLLRQIDPDAEIVAAGLAPAASIEGYSVTIEDFLRGLYDLDALQDVTAIGIHPYSYPEMPSGNSSWNTFAQLPRIQAIMHSYGDREREIWLTEYGAPSEGNGGVGIEMQSDMIVEALQMTEDGDNFGPIFIYTMYDINFDPGDREAHFGLLYGPGNPKPAFSALREAAERCCLLSDLE